MINSLSFVTFELEGATIGLDISGFLAIVAYATIPGLGSASGIGRLMGITSSAIVRSVSRTLYYVGVTS